MTLSKLHRNVWCSLTGFDRSADGKAKVTPTHRLACRVLTRLLRIDKQIRWKLLVREPDYGSVVDRAPDGLARYPRP